jgi:hypothetical protein
MYSTKDVRKSNLLHMINSKHFDYDTNQQDMSINVMASDQKFSGLFILPGKSEELLRNA